MTLNFGKPLSSFEEDKVPDENEIPKRRLGAGQDLLITSPEAPKESLETVNELFMTPAVNEAPQESEIPEERLEVKEELFDLPTEKDKKFDPNEIPKEEINFLPLPNLFPTRREILVSYDFADMIAGQGYRVFYLVSGLDNAGANSRFLYVNKIHSEETGIATAEQTAAITTDTKIDEENWDLTVGVPQTIEGNANIVISWKTSLRVTIGGKNNHLDAYLIVKVKRDRGGAVTTVGTGKTEIHSEATSTTGTHLADYKDTLKLVCTKTRLVKGDILRISVEKWILQQEAIIGGGNDGYVILTYYTDPQETLKTAINYNKPGAEDELFEYAKSKTFEAAIPFQINT